MLTLFCEILLVAHVCGTEPAEDSCNKVCRQIVGDDEKLESRCEGKRACDDLFWIDEDRKMICHTEQDGCISRISFLRRRRRHD